MLFYFFWHNLFKQVPKGKSSLSINFVIQFSFWMQPAHSYFHSVSWDNSSLSNLTPRRNASALVTFLDFEYSSNISIVSASNLTLMDWPFGCPITGRPIFLLAIKSQPFYLRNANSVPCIIAHATEIFQRLVKTNTTATMLMSNWATNTILFLLIFWYNMGIASYPSLRGLANDYLSSSSFISFLSVNALVRIKLTKVAAFINPSILALLSYLIYII